MNAITSKSMVLGLLLAGGVMLVGTREAKAQCYSGGYVTHYAPSYVVTPAPVVVTHRPVYYAAPTYYAPAHRVYHTRRVVHYGHGHRYYHRGHRSGFGFSFGYHR